MSGYMETSLSSPPLSRTRNEVKNGPTTFCLRLKGLPCPPLLSEKLDRPNENPVVLVPHVSSRT